MASHSQLEDEGQEKNGGVKTVIVYFEAEEEVLWRRIEERSRESKGADNAAVVDRELLRVYVKGFERPETGGGEGEVVVVRVE